MATSHTFDNIDGASQVVLRVLELVGNLTPSTKIVKLVYLVDYTYFRHYGETLSGLEYQWDHYGPNALDHAIIGQADSLVSEGLLERKSGLSSHGGPMYLYRFAQAETPSRLSEAGDLVISDIVAQYGSLSVDAITRVSKETAPFANANQYEPLHMEQTMPAMQSEDNGWEAHLLEIEELGTVSLEELVEGYGLVE